MVATAIPSNSDYGGAVGSTPRKKKLASSSSSTVSNGDEPQFDSITSVVLLEHPDDDDDATLEGVDEPQLQKYKPVSSNQHKAVDVAVETVRQSSTASSTVAEDDRFSQMNQQTNQKKPFRRATTIAVPVAVKPRSSESSVDEIRLTNEALDVMLSPAARPLMRSQSCPQRAAAVEAISNRDVRFRFSTALSARESVREMYSHRFREYPSECYRNADVEIQMGPVWRKMHAEITRQGVSCMRTSVFRKKQKEMSIPNDNLLGATLNAEADKAHNEVVLHYMLPGGGKHEKKLEREYKTLHVRFATKQEAEEWVQAVQMLVKWLARVPFETQRKIKVVVNPHSGKRRGRQIYQKWKPLFEMAGIQCDMEETKYSGHARDIGVSLDLREKYEALVFVGGDGTVNEFMNGIFSRDESEWRRVVATTPLSLLSAGTDNAFGLGVGTPTHEASVYCIIKRKIRPLDVVTIEGDREDGTTHREYACCGISYGIGGDIAMESEKMRWMGIYRYAYLKLKRGLLAPRPHHAKLKYVLAEDVPTNPSTGNQELRTFYEIADQDAQDQHHIELCSVYDDSSNVCKEWSGDARALFQPASEEKYAGQWREEEHAYGTVGVSNVYFETKYAHPSDGNMDLIIVRKGPFHKILGIGWRYIAGDYLESSLADYFKIKAMVIEQAVPDPINVDGEVFAGPGPFRIEIVPQLLCVLSEK
ncbi:Agc akt protein kinase, partial [Globisporangium splendens]